MPSRTRSPANPLADQLRQVARERLPTTGLYAPDPETDPTYLNSGVPLPSGRLPQPILAASVRPELVSVKNIVGLNVEAREEAFRKLAEDDPQNGWKIAIVRCNVYKEDGNALFKAQSYDAAVAAYLQAIRAFLGDDAILPSTSFLNDKYLCYDNDDDWRVYLDIAACCNNIAQCYVKTGKLLEAIDWLQETEILYACQRYTKMPSHAEWKSYNLPIVEFYTHRMKENIRLSRIFQDLGNTASCWYFGYLAVWRPAQCPDGVQQIENLKDQVDLEMSQWRHPEPKFIGKTEITQPNLQVRGIWKKLSLAAGPKPEGRLGFASWIYQSKMYLAGGQYFDRDHWCLDLPTTQWRRLQDLPTDLYQPRPLSHQGVCVWEGKAYAYTGSKKLWVFDMTSERWSTVNTELRGQTWPIRNSHITEQCVAVLDGKLYVFGGDDGKAHVGTNIFMVLDLRTMRWSHLGGTSEVAPNPQFPFLRRLSSLWAVPEQKKLYLMYGNASRQSAKIHNAPHGNSDDHTCDDFWSYDVPTNKWTRERLRGNFPSPRTEMASAYSPGLGRAMVYGGYNATMPTTVLEQGKQFTFAFYGDVYLMDPTTKIWQHVIVRSFPSYRAQSQFLVDEATGNIYLYSGYTNSTFVPSKHRDQRQFGDIWQLTLDMPGGQFDHEELAKDIRMAKMGPFMRCFTCGNCGVGWKKCGGTCGGKFFFCSTECLRDGWKEHKQTHGCSKE